MREKKDSKKYINKCICRVTTPATLLNYTVMEWKMRARLLIWCGDAMHSEQTVGDGHFRLAEHQMSSYSIIILLFVFYKSFNQTGSWNTVFILCSSKVVGSKLTDSQMTEKAIEMC